MQNIDLIAIGKMNAAYFAQGVAEYQKRLGGFCNFRIIELPEVQIADKNASDRQIAKALQKEGEAILASVRRGAYLVALCVEGKQVSSEDLAAMIADRAMSGAGDIAFVIGSSHGLDDSVKRAAPAGASCFDRAALPRLHDQRGNEVPQVRNALPNRQGRIPYPPAGVFAAASGKFAPL